jgi:hypothetical protein
VQIFSAALCPKLSQLFYSFRLNDTVSYPYETVGKMKAFYYFILEKTENITRPHDDRTKYFDLLINIKWVVLSTYMRTVN